MNVKKSFVAGSLLLGIALTHAVTAQAAFTNATTTSGLGSPGGSRGAGWADYNQDGCIDVLVTGMDVNPKLFQGHCDGTFTDITATSGINAPIGGWTPSWADYDGDGDMDVYVATNNANNVLWQNNGNGIFTDVSVAAGVADPRGSTGASWGDYNNDGFLDLFVANRFDGVATTDKTDRLYKNNGNGTFTDMAATAGVGGASTRQSFMGAWFDYDNNGTLDLYVTVDFGTDVLYSNNGNNTFTDVSVAAGIGGPQHGMGVAVSDLNMDGCFDIVSTNNTIPTDEEHRASFLYINNCDGTFTESAVDKGIQDRGVVEWGTNFVDFDNDGDLDLSIAAGGMLSLGQANILYENPNVCGAQFINVTDAQGVADTGASYSSTWPDVNNDGKLDWFVTNETGSNKLFINNGPTGNYLKVKLVGDGANTQGVGAVIKVTSGGATQSRVVRAGESYAASIAQDTTFGLGVKQTADKVEVMWPNGAMSELTNVAANQVVEVDSQVVCETGTVTGTTFNPTGAPESAVKVNAKDPATLAIKATATSDANGLYSMSVPVGSYTMTGFKSGFRVGAASAQVEACGTTTANITLIAK